MPWGKFREKLLTAFRFGGEELPDLIWEGLNMTDKGELKEALIEISKKISKRSR